MTYSLDYSRETATENPAELRIWNRAAHQASKGQPFRVAMEGVSPRHSCHVVNAYRLVKEAVAAGLLVDETEIETICYNAGVKGQSLEAMLKSVGHWMHDTASTYWEQGRRDAHVDFATAPEFTVFDRICARVYITVENLGFDAVSVRCDPFDRLYTVSAWDNERNRPVMIARSVLLDDILIMVDAWAIELTVFTNMSRSLRVLHGFEDRVAA